ncbi:MAG: outer membrane lipoprotein-sorting protein [Bacteroidetes bacterium]|nr:outer membrane lipoprotein-sorting protein [Bacteroidota bacterium]
MKLFKSIINTIFFCLSCLLVGFGQTSDEIIKKSEDNMRGKTLRGTMNIKTIRPTWSREMSVNIWLKGNDYAMILVKSPDRDKGITYLRRKKELWNWMPILEKTIKLPPSMMSQAWMGTDFSNDYLVKESSLTTDFESVLQKDSTVDSRVCWKVVLTPKENAAVVWGKVVLFIDKTDYLQLRNEYYDEDGSVLNVAHATEIQKMGGRTIVTSLEMKLTEKAGNKTIITYQSIVFDEMIDDNFFSTANMKQIK